jgi:hypothetical protein
MSFFRQGTLVEIELEETRTEWHFYRFLRVEFDSGMILDDQVSRV